MVLNLGQPFHLNARIIGVNLHSWFLDFLGQQILLNSPESSCGKTTDDDSGLGPGHMDTEAATPVVGKRRSLAIAVAGRQGLFSSSVSLTVHTPERQQYGTDLCKDNLY